MSQQPFIHLYDPPKHWNIKWFIMPRQPLPIIVITTTTIINISWMSDIMVFFFFLCF